MALEVHDTFAAVEDDWETLAARTDAPPFSHPGWISAWCAAFGPGRLELFVLRRDAAAEAVLPALRRRRSLGSPTNDQTPSFGAVCGGGAAARELAGALLAQRVAWLDLAYLDAGDPLVDELARLGAEAGWRSMRATLLRLPYLSIEGSWSSFESQLAGGFGREMTRRQRGLQREGALSFEFTRGGLDRLLDEGFAIEGSGLEGRAGNRHHLAPETERFYREVAHWAAEREWLRLGFARLGSRPIAFNFSPQLAHQSYSLRSGFDPAFSRFDPRQVARPSGVARASR